MLFLFSLIFASTFSLTAKSTLKKHPYPWYAAAFLLSLFLAFYSIPEAAPAWICTVADLFRRGSLACAFWCVVMWTGALPNGSKLIRRLMPVRGELSILAAALTLGHNIGYGKTYFVRLLTNPSSLPANQLAACIVTILLLLIMIPLTILSFPRVRKRMKAKKWKQIQRFAYLFYALIYLHIMLLFFPLSKNGNVGCYVSSILYTVIFLGYAICRIRKWIFLRKKPVHAHKITSICIELFLLIMLLFCAVSAPSASVRTNDSKMQKDMAEAVAADPETSTDLMSENNLDETSSSLADGTYQGKAFGYDGSIKATVTIENGIITAISCSSSESDLWYFDKCEQTVIAEILAAQNTDVDVVSGATYSSNGIKKAVLDAISQARGD